MIKVWNIKHRCPFQPASYWATIDFRSSIDSKWLLNDSPLISFVFRRNTSNLILNSLHKKVVCKNETPVEMWKRLNNKNSVISFEWQTAYKKSQKSQKNCGAIYFLFLIPHKKRAEEYFARFARSARTFATLSVSATDESLFCLIFWPPPMSTIHWKFRKRNRSNGSIN